MGDRGEDPHRRRRTHRCHLRARAPRRDGGARAGLRARAGGTRRPAGSGVAARGVRNGGWEGPAWDRAWAECGPPPWEIGVKTRTAAAGLTAAICAHALSAGMAVREPVFAHGLVGRADLPVPAWLFGWAA